jgi:hypothetical protein
MCTRRAVTRRLRRAATRRLKRDGTARLETEGPIVYPEGRDPEVEEVA